MDPIWRPPISGDDFGLLFWGKNVGRILTLLVREIELSEHVETAPRTGGKGLEAAYLGF